MHLVTIIQVAGLRYVFNASLATPADFNQPMQAKARLVYAKLLVNGAEVDINPCSTYTIITNDYLAGMFAACWGVSIPASCQG